ncbi:MAG: hypothetical protein ACYCVH_11040 [Ignavibacteriaceae bacterium]
MTQTMKIISFEVLKPGEYRPISKREKQRVRRLMIKEVLAVANKFDGTSKFIVHIYAKGKQ